MRVLVCGARGFLGRSIGAALARLGHTVVAGVSGTPTGATEIRVDYARDLQPEDWRPRLADLDAVVNAVGVLRDTRRRPLAAVHAQAPGALFEACAQVGVRRIVQVSALGVDRSDTAYARTKRAAEIHLQSLTESRRLDAAIVRPSVIFGAGGASSELLLLLSKLPWLWLPEAFLQARIQPVAVNEVAEVVAGLVHDAEPVDRFARTPLDAVGPQALTMGEFVASLRAQTGHPPATVAVQPNWIARLSARVGDAVPASPWCSDTLSMLGTDNVADPERFRQCLGREATHYSQMVPSLARR